MRMRLSSSSPAWWLLVAVAFTTFVGAGLSRAADSPASAPVAEPGLWLTFESLDGKTTDTRPARLIALHVPANSPPSVFSPPGRFRATFSGSINLKLRDEFIFTAEGRGALELSVNGEVVLHADGDDLSTQGSKPAKLKKGANAVVARYTAPADGDATLRLYWTPKKSFLQPIPPTVYSRASDETAARLLLVREGRNIVGTMRCVRCHAAGEPNSDAMPELAMDAPKLDDAGARLNRAWIARWIGDPKSIRPDATMPRLFHAGDGSDEARAQDSAAYLATLGKPDADPTFTDADAAAGRTIFSELGCVACHTAPDQDTKQGFTPLRHVKAKWKPAALQQYLLAPERTYAWTRMPNFKLSADEARQLTAYLLGAAPDDPTSQREVAGADAHRGRMLVESAGCLNCHTIVGAKSSLVAPSLPGMSTRDAWRRGCAGGADTRGSSSSSSSSSRAPDFAMTERQLDAARAVAETDRSSLARDAAPEFAERQIRLLNCTACHTRDGQMDVWSSITPLVPAPAADAPKTDADQTRPTLTWAGEKLRPEWMAKFIAGEIAYKPRPWLHARMPAFASRAKLLAQGLSFEHGYSLTIPEEPPVDAELAAIGRKLSGRLGGLSCNQCHAINQSPALVPFDSPAANFMYVAERLRKDYYHRWTRNPQVYQPGTKMPTFADADGKTSFKEILGGDAHAQFEAIWQYLRAADQIVPPE